MVELHNVREQLYLVRFDDLRETEVLKKDVQNYLAEIERLDAKVGKLKEKMMESYIKSLNLELVQIVPPQRSHAPGSGTGFPFSPFLHSEIQSLFVHLSSPFSSLVNPLRPPPTIFKKFDRNLKEILPSKISLGEPCLVMI